jgi:hypothetical protein
MNIDFNKAKGYTDQLEKLVGYGTEDFAIFLYSIIKMRRPKKIVELGTGVGSVMIWAGLACKENNFGKITTIDNGLHWNQDIKYREDNFLFKKEYNDFINYLIKDNEIEDFVVFKNEDIDIGTINNILDIDILFVDFDHSPLAIHKIIESCMPRMSDHSIIFFDSASTYFPSYMLLENIIDQFNKNNIPSSFNFNNKAKNFILNSKFTLTHMVEDKDRHQNSTAMIEIKTKDCFPNSKLIRF